MGNPSRTRRSSYVDMGRIADRAIKTTLKANFYTRSLIVWLGLMVLFSCVMEMRPYCLDALVVEHCRCSLKFYIYFDGWRKLGATFCVGLLIGQVVN
jgi:hypothetical protein